MKNLFFIALILLNNSVNAQLDDDFTDGNLTSNPKWTGSNGGIDFTVSDGKLQSNASVANSNFYLSTENNLSLNAKWDFWVNLQLSTSGVNYVDVYIISDKADLKNPIINGYFVRIGNTDDEISLYKRSGTAASSVKIIDGLNGSVSSANNTINVRLERDSNGKFTLERQIVPDAYFREGAAIDLSHTFTSHFGILIQQSTASFFSKHFFDKFKIAPVFVDTFPPEIAMVSALDSNTIEIAFSEPMDSLTAKVPSNYIIVDFPGNILRVLTTNDPAKYRVRLTNSLTDGIYRLSGVNLKDRHGNLMDVNNSSSFSYSRPYIAKRADLIISEIFADPSPQIDLPSVEFAELYNNTNKAINLKNWKFSDAGATAVIAETVLESHAYLIICARSDTAEYKSFGKVVGLSSWPSLNNAGDILKLISPENLIVDSVAYSDSWYRHSTKKQGGWTLERKDPTSACEGALNWSASIDTTGGTPGRQNSIYISGFDHLPLHADSLHVLSDSTLKVYFNKPLNSGSVIQDNFRISPNSLAPKKVIADLLQTTVVLTFEQKFRPLVQYQLAMKNLKDCGGTTIISPSQLTFKLNTPNPVYERPDTSRIMVTEIFADPSPEIGLPLSEFVEIHNPGKDTVDLSNWTISDATTKGTVLSSTLLPGEYAILCRVADTSQYNAKGKTIGVQPWPSLNNNSDHVTLRTFKGRLIDSVAYADNWHRDNTKMQGGWSLEKIDLNSNCPNFLNWATSSDTSGGTPGKQNSVYISSYRLIELYADSLKQISDTSVKILFNKHLDASTLKIENFTLNPQNATKKINADRELLELTIVFENKLLPGTNYQLNLTGLGDCSGILLSAPRLLGFKTDPSLPVDEIIDTSRVIITEIFADPSPEVDLPLSEFVEIFNPGSDTVNISKWILSDTTTDGLITSGYIPPGEFVILCATSDTASFSKYGRTRGVAPWPTFTNNKDQIILKTLKRRLVDSIAYSDQWYKDDNKKKGGWSLEKIQLLNNTCNGLFNWTSSLDISGGTPGRANSVQRNTADSQPLRLDSLHYTSDSTLTAYINRYVDTRQIKPANFYLNNGIGNPVEAALDSSYLKVHLTFGSKFKEGVDYLLTLSSLTHCDDTIRGPNNQVVFTIPVLPEIEYPVIITEIMPDPTPSVGMPEIEYVELHNPTNRTVTLIGMSYGDGVLQHTFTSGQIGPGDYLILCPERDTLSFRPLGNVRGLPDWPSLNNDHDILFLKNNKGREIHRLAYNVSWFKDSQKRAGGYSLEIINPGSICAGAANWSDSKAPAGGTPGRENSINNKLPLEVLKVVGAEMMDSISLRINFNKAVDSLTAANTLNYLINNGIGKPASATPLDPSFEQVLLTLAEPPARGRTFTIQITNVRDCTGSTISEGYNEYEFILTTPIRPQDVLISEILFNPRPGGVDFIEIYNNTSHAFDLKDLSIATITKDTVANSKPLSAKQMLFNPGNILALSSNPDLILKDYPMGNRDSILIVTLPAFNDNSGSAVLTTKDGIIDRFNYSEKMHFQLLKNFEGISLERSNFTIDANEPGNFRSATAASGFATPGRKNSQANSTIVGVDELSLSSRTFSPDNDGFEDLLQVNYNMPTAGMIANVKIFNDQGVLIKNLLKNHTLNAKGILVWDGLDEFNHYAGTGMYVIYAEVFDVNGFMKRFRRSFALAVKL